MRACAAAMLLLLASGGAPEGRQDASGLREGLVAAVKPALPFPDATADGTAEGGRPEPVWTVRWPDGEAARIEILANPLNADNRTRALKAEAAIQKSAMQSQQRSQADYEKAVSDFQRSGRVSEIREISLQDDGLVGERYDAESQLTIEARTIDVPYRVTVATARLPEAFPGSDGPTAIVRVSANEYQEAGDAGQPAAARFCAEQAWVFFGPVSRPIVSPTGGNEAGISVERAALTAGGTPVVVSIRGNVELVDRVLQGANWALLKARLGG